MSHSKVVGSSTAKILMNCQGWLKLKNTVPPQLENDYMARGTLLHSAIEATLNGISRDTVAKMSYKHLSMNEDLLDVLDDTVRLLDEIDPDKTMEYSTETQVSFGDAAPGVFGTADLIAKLNGRAILADFKFGQGVPVDAEENDQLFFAAAAAMRTPSTQWAFQDADEVEFIIIQPPFIKRWTTTIDRVMLWEQQFLKALAIAQGDNAPLKKGEHCRFCSAKPICPIMTGAVDRALKLQIDQLPIEHINNYLKNADLLEQWIADLRALAFQAMENGAKLPDWKLVAKRGTRKWVDPKLAASSLESLGIDPYAPKEVLSPAQAEKALKKVKQELPADLVVSVSSGSTLAPRDDSRPEVLNIGNVLANALGKLV